MPMPQRSLIGHPGATFLEAVLTPHLFVNFFTSSCHRVSPSPGFKNVIGDGEAYFPGFGHVENTRGIPRKVESGDDDVGIGSDS
jgi:hypothetical protein